MKMQATLLPNSKPAVFLITSEEQVKAYVHPIRMKIMGFLVKNAMTISQVAKALQVHPANITHHFKILTRAKLVCLVEERDIGRNIEKYYRAVARNFDIRPAEGEVSNANAKVLDFLKNDLNSAVNNLAGDDREDLIGLINQAKISKDQFNSFCKKIKGLVRDFGQADSTDGTGYTINLSLYPCQVDYGPLKRLEIRKRRDPTAQMENKRERI